MRLAQYSSRENNYSFIEVVFREVEVLSRGSRRKGTAVVNEGLDDVLGPGDASLYLLMGESMFRGSGVVDTCWSWGCRHFGMSFD